VAKQSCSSMTSLPTCQAWEIIARDRYGQCDLKNDVENRLHHLRACVGRCSFVVEPGSRTNRCTSSQCECSVIFNTVKEYSKDIINMLYMPVWSFINELNVVVELEKHLMPMHVQCCTIILSISEASFGTLWRRTKNI